MSLVCPAVRLQAPETTVKKHACVFSIPAPFLFLVCLVKFKHALRSFVVSVRLNNFLFKVVVS